MKKLFLGVFLFAGGLYIFISSYLFFTQDIQIFPGQVMPLDFDTSFDLVEDITFTTKDGIILDGARFVPAEKSDTLLLYFGGNADNAKQFLRYTQKYTDNEVIAFNYRGYAKSEGKPSEQRVFEDAAAIYENYAKEKKVFIIGRSLGSGVAAYLASKKEAVGLLLITPFDSIASIAKQKYPLLPIDYLLKHRFESDRYIEDVEEKIAIIEVAKDTTVPNFHTKKLMQKIEAPFFHTLLNDTSHGEVLNHPSFFTEIEKALHYCKID